MAQPRPTLDQHEQALAILAMAADDGGKDEEDGVCWECINGLVDTETDDDADDDSSYVMEASVKNRNDQLVNTKLATIHQASEQEAVLLLGNQWNHCVRKNIK